MTTYKRVDADTMRQIARVMKAHHEHLLEAGVTICAMFAYAKKDELDQPIGPALKFHGHAAAATIRIVQLKDRAKSIEDVELLIDGDEWDERDEKEQLAIIDHELTHIELVYDQRREVKVDALDRPKMKLRLHDWEMGFFNVVAERHGIHSLEVQHIRALVARTGQLYFPFDMQSAIAEGAQVVRLSRREIRRRLKSEMPNEATP